MKRKKLSEQEQLQIIQLIERHGKRWELISREMKTRSPPTIKSFYQKFERTRTISSHAGRPKKIDSTIENGVVGSMIADREQLLQNIAFDFDISSVKTILNKNHITYHDKICIPPLQQQHKDAIINMCKSITSVPYSTLFPIIFTDESTVVENLNNGGVWRE